jgi:tRNA-binding EMAP/Myf-like protein
MPVIAMKCTQKTAHERTDQLFIYTFSSPELGDKTIVANLTNVYEEGQVAGIAQLGTWLPEGEILPRKVFGIPSEGMAMGLVEADVDTNVTAHFDADAPERAFKVSVEVSVTSRYPKGAEKLARHAIGKGEGALLSTEPA